jgi:hypothetical protein
MTKIEQGARIGMNDSRTCTESGAKLTHDVSQTFSDWQPIETAPNGRTPHDRILVGFMGQFAWVPFVAYPMGAATQAAGYAKPTHWAPIPEPPK